MALATGQMLRDLMCRRMTNADGYFDAFELAFFPGNSPPYITQTIYDTPLVVFPLAANWANYFENEGVVMVGTHTAATTAPGVAAFFRFNGIKAGTPTALLQGSIGERGSGADMIFSHTGWPVGLPVSINGLRFYPPQFKN